jgi:hypothetical protein
MISDKSFIKDNSGNIIKPSRSNYLDIFNTLRNSNNKWFSRDFGLSTDSYLALLKQAAREGSPYELRYSPDGFTVFNN